MPPTGTFQYSWLRVAVTMACLLTSVAAIGAAEAKGKKVAATEDSNSRAQLRVWKDMFENERALKIQVKSSGRKSSPAEIQLGGGGYQFRDYIGVPTGNVLVEVFDSGDSRKKLLSLPATFAEGAFFTLIVHEKGEGIGAELLDDSLPEVAEIAELTVRNFVPSLAMLQIRAGEAFNARLMSADGFLHVRGLPREVLEIETSGTEKSGKKIKWTTEIDFSKNRKATLLIYPDTHGRVRPRVAVDGELPVVAEEDSQKRAEN